MDIHLIAYYIGILTVFGSHIAIISGNVPPMVPHSLVNLVAGALIAYYFMNKEGFIKF